MTSMVFSILMLMLGLWIYSIISILSNTFKNKDEKIFWTIGIIFVPLLAFFYIFKKNDLLKYH